MHIDKNVISNFAARAIILKLLGCGSFKNDVTTGSKGRRLKKWWQKKTKVVGATPYGDVTYSVFDTDHLFYL